MSTERNSRERLSLQQRFMMRFTVVDSRGTVSFVAPAHLMKAFAAGCARGASDALDLLRVASACDQLAVERIRRDLHIFDEYHTSNRTEHLETWLSHESARRPFRVFDHVSRQVSLRPEGAGLVVFNLLRQRIVQVQNSFAELRRRDRGRIRRDGKPTPQLYRYELPAEWRILPERAP
ncbi:MAG TPA: hypothetical protein VGR16_09350 [Thermomicrobiales bacterium]|nr:hypothetical protein [Thermomicrobiales bacterium]